MAQPVRRGSAALVLLLALSLTAVACGGGGGGGGGGNPAKSSTATTANLTRSAAYAKPGPYPVGYTQLSLNGRAVIVWYPADPAAVAGKPKVTYDQRPPLPASFKASVPDQYNTVVTMNAYADVAPSAKGPFPV